MTIYKTISQFMRRLSSASSELHKKQVDLLHLEKLLIGMNEDLDQVIKLREFATYRDLMASFESRIYIAEYMDKPLVRLLAHHVSVLPGQFTSHLDDDHDLNEILIRRMLESIPKTEKCLLDSGIRKLVKHDDVENFMLYCEGIPKTASNFAMIMGVLSDKYSEKTAAQLYDYVHSYDKSLTEREKIDFDISDFNGTATTKFAMMMTCIDMNIGWLAKKSANKIPYFGSDVNIFRYLHEKIGHLPSDIQFKLFLKSPLTRYNSSEDTIYNAQLLMLLTLPNQLGRAEQYLSALDGLAVERGYLQCLNAVEILQPHLGKLPAEEQKIITDIVHTTISKIVEKNADQDNHQASLRLLTDSKLQTPWLHDLIKNDPGVKRARIQSSFEL